MTLCNCGCGQELWIDHNAGEKEIDVVLRVSAPPESVRDLIATISFYLRHEGRFERRVTLTDEQRIELAKELAPELVDALKALLDWGRDHTSPTQPDTPHALLVEAHRVLNL